MKRFFLLTFIVTIFFTGIAAQNSVFLKIHHKLGDTDFALDIPTSNNLGHQFKLTRLQYYISEISIIHDGGLETPIEDKYVLVKNGSVLPTLVDLGDHNIMEVEGINFHVGVDSAHNHLDPATYPSTHPLAPQNPSMHWGWIGGYRFIAIEGHGGDNLNHDINLHGLGDNNYFKTQIDLTATAENNEITIHIDADYTRAVENIAVDAELIVHGDYAEAKLALENFRDYVFSPSSSITSLNDLNSKTTLDLFPNPTVSGMTSVKISSTQDLIFDVNVFTILGKQIKSFANINANSIIDLNLDFPGMYIINLGKDGHIIHSKKLIVN